MQFNFRLYFLLLVITLPAYASSQESPLNFDHITGAKEVSLGKITSITQDKFGYMWFADQTNRSVMRYDGYTIKPYYHVTGDTNSLTTTGIEAIAADTAGNIWVG